MQKHIGKLKYLILFILIYIPIFGSLDVKPIRVWDEARLAGSAIEMSKNNNWLVVYFENKPEMWSTKPPLMIWLQTICIKIFGISELSIRLPSALAAFFTCCLLLYVSSKYLKKPWLGIISVLVLITSNGYIDDHATRTGDYDALLALFTTTYCLLFFIYTETKDKKHLYLFFLSLTLATLTKGVAGILFLPALFLFALFFKQIIPLLKNKHFYFGIGVFLFFVLGYYFLREAYNPGYLKAVSENELGGRFNQTNENHGGNIWFYFDFLTKKLLSNWYFLLPCGLLIGFSFRDKIMFKFAILITFSFIIFGLIISTAATKLRWYAVPLYPFIALIIGIFIHFIFTYLKENKFAKNQLSLNTIPYAFLFLIFLNPFLLIIDKTYKPIESNEPGEFTYEFYELSYFFKNNMPDVDYDLNNHFYVHYDYGAEFDFYLEMMQQRGVNIKTKPIETIVVGDRIIINQEQAKYYVQNKFYTTELRHQNTIYIYKLDSLKK